jgi:flavorubredoxin
MDSIVTLRENIFWLGVNDRESDLFEGIWPLPFGVAYNSYLIRDEKTALIDTVKAVSSTAFVERLRSLLSGRPLDYLIVNHLEPDHSGTIKLVRALYPQVEIIGNRKTAEFLTHLYQVQTKVKAVEDGERLSLGSRALQFHLIPMVHWPETMVAYDEREKLLFSTDAFGAFGTHDGGIFDDQLDHARFESEMLRYFANIVAKYCVMVQKALAKLKPLEITMIAPAHGPIWRSQVSEVIARYDRWSRYIAEPGVMVAYGSMYGNSRRLMEAVIEGLKSTGEKRIVIHDVSRTHLSYILRDAWRYQAILLGAPTYDTKLFPPMGDLLDRFERKGLKNRLVGIFGTYGWSGGGVSTIKDFVGRSGWKLIEPVIEARFSATDADLENARRLGVAVAEQLRT